MTMFNVSPAVPLITQEDSATCWLACCKMMYQWKTRKAEEVDSTLIAASANDPDVDYDTWCRSGLDKPDLVPLAKALGFRWGAGGKLDPIVLRDSLKLFGPIIAVGSWNSYSHVVVITGFDPDDVLQSLIVNNPWPEPGTLTGAVQPRNLNWLNRGLGTWQSVNGEFMHW
jgi:hypothetical protein